TSACVLPATSDDSRSRSRSAASQQRLYLRPLPHGQSSFRLIRATDRRTVYDPPATYGSSAGTRERIGTQISDGIRSPYSFAVSASDRPRVSCATDPFGSSAP